ncbi:hypothetical protein DMENIID0001_156030 [Sergentomyia squamirostris]
MKEIKVEKPDEGDLKLEMKVDNVESLENDSICVKEENPNVTEITGIKEEKGGSDQFEVIEMSDVVAKVIKASLLQPPRPFTSSTTSNLNQCVYCKKTFVHRVRLHRHITHKHRGFPIDYTGGSVLCQLCWKICNGLEILTEHIRDSHPLELKQPEYECAHCGCKWRKMVELRRHMVTHTTKRAFCCDICSKSFKTRDILHRHVKNVHGTDGNFRCSDCPKKFKAKQYLMAHQAIHNDNLTLKCSICKEIFSSRHRLQYHRRLFHNEKTFDCSICSMKFKMLSSFKGHMSIHSEERPFQCQLCQRKFKMQRYYRGHMRMHELKDQLSKYDESKSVTEDGEKPYKCNVCNRAFEKSKTYEWHIVTHLPEANFKCQHCPKAFKGDFQLSYHIKYYHSGECTCSICGKVFYGKLSLKRHMNHHKRSTQFKCHHCPRGYKEKERLLRHFIQKHNMATETAVKSVKEQTTVKTPVEQFALDSAEPEGILESIIVKTEYEIN